MSSISLPKHPKLTQIRSPSISPKPNSDLTTPTPLQRLSKEPIFILGAHLAILMQWSNPSLATGSLHRSRFANHPLSRLKRTSIYMTAAVYGSQQEKEAIFSVVHKQHAFVRGAGYDANDPALQCWTAATLFVALIIVHETFLGEMEREEIEVLMRESRVFGESLGMSGRIWPGDLGGFYGYWDGCVENARVGNEARRLKELLTRNGNFPWYIRCALPVIMMLTAKWLPPRLRIEYGLPDPDTWVRTLWYEVCVWLIRWLYWLIPGWVKGKAHQRKMQDMQHAVVEIGRTGRWPV